MNLFLVKSAVIVGLLAALVPAVRPVRISLLPSWTLSEPQFGSIGVLLRNGRGETIDTLCLHQDGHPTSSADLTLPATIVTGEIESLCFVGLTSTMTVSLAIPFSRLQEAIANNDELELKYGRENLSVSKGARCF